MLSKEETFVKKIKILFFGFPFADQLCFTPAMTRKLTERGGMDVSSAINLSLELNLSDRERIDLAIVENIS
ncbi:hypothetical protein C7H19_10440 [Aphanothece hegewaldii CCALA 016]|uniref:Uncharacterized protein n=1 Tax=Aphanothece hegewaldii CCALA 016 TaxID=2107694 RepID=A0A2T1LY80_9CHRO|nr:hypothetical protein C7H19_10440 [Aphanothece hegewaldii CCALA 016]